jgi:hypothetical protein
MSEFNEIDRMVMESPELLGKECIGCYRVLAYKYFDKDSSSRDGRKHLCALCQTAERLSTEEHIARQKEMNYNASQSQRWDHQEELYDDAARVGKPLLSNDLVFTLRELIPNLYITQGRIIGDLAVFKTYGTPQPSLDGKTFEYLFYIPTGILPEFSQYEFNDRNVAVREKQRGWRTVLLRLIKAKMLTEEMANKVFGPAEGKASARYNRKLYEFRNSL